ncbi:MAG: D-alanine--D-alanine ligase family protein [Spirochaeta sp.]
MRTAIIYGGRSGEHDVSCVSAANVLREIDRERFTPVPIGIDRDGSWFLQDMPSESDLEANILHVEPNSSRRIAFQPGTGFTLQGENLGIDVVFPVLHGTFGEDGTVQGLMDLLDIPYVGSGVRGSSISMDKVISKQLWEHHRLPVVPYITLHAHMYEQDKQEFLYRIESELGIPVFIKPARGGSSVGVYKAHTSAELHDCIVKAFQYDTKLIIEKSVTAVEVECSVLGNSAPHIFPPASIRSTHEYYDYEAKYQDPDGAHFNIPADIPEDIRDSLMQLAARAFSAVDARGLARIDFFYDEDSGSLYLNEINTMPGFTSISLFPRMCEDGGLPYKQLITGLVDLAIQEHALRASLRYQR